MRRRAAALLSILAWAALDAAAQVNPSFGRHKLNDIPEVEEQPWQEQDVEPPAFPKKEDLREFYVSAVATNKYMIDAATLSVGSDGIVRYVLVVETSGGATNVSFEGINCKDRAWKHYASGNNANSTWTRSRRAQRMAPDREQAGQSASRGTEPRPVLSDGQRHPFGGRGTQRPAPGQAPECDVKPGSPP